MRAISLWQPWASLWLSPRKIHETRHWKLQVPTGGFWLAVHAAKRMQKSVDPLLRAILEDEFGDDWATELPTGAVVGAVFVTDCLRTEVVQADISASTDDLACGDFARNRFAWRRSRFQKLDRPAPWIGRQGLFSVPDALFETVAA